MIEIGSVIRTISRLGQNHLPTIVAERSEILSTWSSTSREAAATAKAELCGLANEVDLVRHTAMIGDDRD